MLNAARVLQYVKTNIGFPYQFVELEDSEILEYIRNFTIRTFGQYFPDTKTIGLNLQTTSNKVPNKANEYYIEEEDGREILGVAHISFGMGNQYLFGHPPYGPMTLTQISQWALDTEVANWVKSFSSWNYTFVFQSPNIVSIRPTPSTESWVAVEYERHHAEDFSTIQNDLQMYFLELCLADIMIVIGRIRKKYASGGLQSPFGNIQLDDGIFDEGITKRNDILEKLAGGALLNVVVSFG